jgi:hypothetical protein
VQDGDVDDVLDPHEIACRVEELGEVLADSW